MDAKERCRRGSRPQGRALVAAVVALTLAASCSGRQAPPQAPPAVPVSVAKVVVADTPVEARNIGTVTAYSSVVIRSQIAGPIVQVDVDEGVLVGKGQLLFVIDPRPAQAALAQAKAALARDTGRLEFARRELQRVENAAEGGAASPNELDTARVLARTAAATVAVDKAAVEAAELQLAYSYIHAPIEGVAGELTTKTGNVVRANETALLTLNQIHPIYVNFTLAQRYLDDVRRFQRLRGPLPLEAYVGGRDHVPSRGALTFINNAVDVATGTILLKGTFANDDNRLWPGQFVEVALTLTTQTGAVLIPSHAVQTSQRGTFVFVIDNDLKAHMQLVEVDRTQGEQSVIARGLSGGQTVVVDGQLRLEEGAAVQIRPMIMPDEAATRPATAPAASGPGASQ
ncbi:MAG: efflux RND transporter periplasmic adaptor subunit [Planctomycetaceae bacterium]|nr:efflux RND transporter periplasmic adaptor subunit [Planctomycetaceae bacterium]